MKGRSAVALVVALWLHAIAWVWFATPSSSETDVGQLPPGSGTGPDGSDAQGQDLETPEDVAQTIQIDVAMPADMATTASVPETQTIQPKAKAKGGGGNTYFGRLRAHLNRYKQDIAQGYSGRGVALVRFVVAGDGAVSGVQLGRSSGDERLDRQALALVLRASPLPPPPDAQGLNLMVPVEFGD